MYYTPAPNRLYFRVWHTPPNLITFQGKTYNFNTIFLLHSRFMLSFTELLLWETNKAADALSLLS